jgi:hypothetical protein
MPRAVVRRAHDDFESAHARGGEELLTVFPPCIRFSLDTDEERIYTSLNCNWYCSLDANRSTGRIVRMATKKAATKAPAKKAAKKAAKKK